MPGLSYARHCAEIITQTDLLGASIAGAERSASVPSCPDWNLAQLLRHVGGMHRWAAEIARTRATEPPCDDQVREVFADTGQDVHALEQWLVRGATHLADTLRAAGAGARMWTPVPVQTAAFWARRMAHETLLHRADAAQAVGAKFTAEVDVASDALDEWMEAGSLPQVFEAKPHMRELLGSGHTVRLHATDVTEQSRADWLVDFTGEGIVWRRAGENASVAARGTLTNLLLVVYGRRAAGEGVELLGDSGVWDSWLDGVSFWLYE